MKKYFRPSLSTILVFFFFIVLLFLGLFAEVFESKTPEINLAQIYSNPVPTNELKRVKKIKLTNKHGVFVFENTDPQARLDGPWQMIEPQPLKAKSDIIKKIVDAFLVIRVRNFHRLEPLNITSFSLDNPTLTLNLETPKKKIYEIKMGLINPIDNSAYMSISSQDQIYQIDPLEISLESYDLPQLVESKVLALNLESMASMELYEQNNLLFKFLKKDDQWIDQNGAVLTNSKVNNFFDKLEAVKSSSILEHLNPDQKDFLNKVLSSSSYTLKIISNVGVRNYFFSELKSGAQNPGLPKEALGSFVMASEDKDSFVLIDISELNFFQVRSKDFK